MEIEKYIGDTRVNPIGVGTWMMGGGYLEGKIPFATYGNEPQEIAAIRYSISRGQNHIDTAHMYGAGHTEEIVGQAISEIERSTLFIASKVWKSHCTRLAVPQSIIESLRRLRITQLDLVYAHYAFKESPMEEYIGGLNDAIDQGLTKYIGVSNFSLEELKLATSLSKHPITAIQNHFNVLHKAEFPLELQNFCKANDIAMVSYRPLGRGMLTQECTNETLIRLADKYQKTTAQIALNWVLSHANMHAIPKASRIENIEANLAALNFELSEEDRASLSALPDEQQKYP